MSEYPQRSDGEVLELPSEYANFGYLLTWFEQDPGDALVGECPIEGVSRNDLMSLFGLTSPATMDTLAHPVTDAHVPFLCRHVTCAIDLIRFDYFVEGWALP
jgi:hypothetical protein